MFLSGHVGNGMFSACRACSEDAGRIIGGKSLCIYTRLHVSTLLFRCSPSCVLYIVHVLYMCVHISWYMYLHCLYHGSKFCESPLLKWTSFANFALNTAMSCEQSVPLYPRQRSKVWLQDLSCNHALSWWGLEFLIEIYNFCSQLQTSWNERFMK